MTYLAVGKENNRDIHIYFKDWGSHGICSTHKDQVNADLLAFISEKS